MTTKYSFDTGATYEFRGADKRKHRRGGNSYSTASNTDSDADADPTDGSASLTYSAASSIHSAGESTDSSFADIMRVLDGQDSKELSAYLKREGGGRHGKDERSVTESLAYSTDAESQLRSLATDMESHLQGADIASTMTGQPSDQNYDAGGWAIAGEREDSNGAADDILFSPAEHTDSLKRRRDRKRRERKDKTTEKSMDKNMEKIVDRNATPRVKNSTVAPTKERAPLVESRQGTPPTARPPKSVTQNIEMTIDDDVWYAKWWMFCFPDTVKNMTAKR